MRIYILALGIILSASTNVLGQYTFATTIQGQTGIDVDITITFNDVIVNTANCTNGFTYQLQFDYDVVYNQFGVGNGNNDLNTLQGYLACGPGNQSYFNLPNEGGSGTGLTANNWTPLTNCGSVRVEDLMCDQIDLVFQGPGIPNQTRRLEAISSLPVEFIDFTGEVNSEYISLEWSTASERNNDYFTVERSFDGESWEQRFIIDGAGTTSNSSSYSAIDEISNTLVYYRLKQHDFDGTSTLLKIISVKSNSSVHIIAYPNPVSSVLTLKGIHDHRRLQLIDITGKNHIETVHCVRIGNNLQIDMSSLLGGIYFLQTPSEQIKVVKN